MAKIVNTVRTVMATRIEIKNKLEILPGNVIRIPGCEPVTSFTSLALAANLDCNASVITLEKAFEAIPDARIVKVLTPSGVPGTGKFFELPSGPAVDGNVCPCPDIIDFYRILKDAADPIDFDAIEEDNGLENCASINNFTGRVTFQDQFHTAPDPKLRPNTRPLGATGLR